MGSEESGLYEVDVSNVANPRLIKHHVTVKSNKKSFSSNSVSCIIKQDNKLFIGTNGDGLFIYENNGNFDKRTISDGLPSNNIISVSGVTDTTTWILTNSGLVLYNWRENTTRLVGKTKGFICLYTNRMRWFLSLAATLRLLLPGDITLFNWLIFMKTNTRAPF